MLRWNSVLVTVVAVGISLVGAALSYRYGWHW